MKKLFSKSIKRIIEKWAVNEWKVAFSCLIIALALPIVLNTRYLLSVMTICCVNSILAVSLNMLTGYLGITSLGHAAFYGLGAYTAAILGTRFELNIIVTLPAGMIIAGIAAFLLGLAAIRAPSRHLAIITLGFCEIVKIVELNWFSFTGGANGIHSVPRISLLGWDLSGKYAKYYLALFLLILTISTISLIMHSKIGRAIYSIRDNEIAAESMGVNVFSYKLFVFTFSAMFAGLAGAFYAHHFSYVSPLSFTFEQSIVLLSMVILGGIGSMPGTIIGAIILSLLPELLRDFTTWRQVIYGAIIVILMVARPSGMLGKYNFSTSYIFKLI
jgi:branched-chain amino acid transport system permease protein